MIWSKTLAVVVMSLALITPLTAQDQAQLGALAPANLAKPRPKPPFDLTGTWLHDNSGGANSWRFVPPAFKLTPDAQEDYDASQRAAKEGKVYRDDIGQCCGLRCLNHASTFDGVMRNRRAFPTSEDLYVAYPFPTGLPTKIF